MKNMYNSVRQELRQIQTFCTISELNFISTNVLYFFRNCHKLGYKSVFGEKGYIFTRQILKLHLHKVFGIHFSF